MQTIDITADIVPGEGLAGLKVRTPIRQLSEWLSALHLRTEVASEIVGMFEVRYRFLNAPVELALDVRAGKLARITANEGYRGTLFGKIRPGIQVTEAFNAESRLYYDEAEELILCRGVSGVALDVSARDPDPKDVGHLTISSVSVFVTEIDTVAGQRGEW